ncbi:deoxynucleotide monophosphate kinase [Pseudomonas sp. AA27]|uniref:deoxynucleotide monophosphate kinase family protein n=1 Tax=Pseudomonas sp. AA27 TaxID=2908652 RepID=UPI001F2F5EE1|nr:deoxynucleotide monophosphate kinase [Pseudomonas sp. AA27]MCF1488363.1 deoxynucleotide monophosphate kinase [Pseudomonas sp. AA27]
MRKIIGLAAPARSGKDTVAAVLLKQPGVAAYALADPLKMGCQALWGLSDEQTWSDDLKEQPIALWQRSPRELFQQVGTEWMRERTADHWLMRAELAINPPAGRATDDGFVVDLNATQAPFRLAAQAFFGFSDAQLWDERLSGQIDPYWSITPRSAVEFLSARALALYSDYAVRRAASTVALSRPLSSLPDEAHTIIIKDIRYENEAAYLRQHNGRIWHIRRPNPQRVNPHSSESGIEIQPQDILIDNDQTIDVLAERVMSAWKMSQPLCSKSIP